MANKAPSAAPDNAAIVAIDKCPRRLQKRPTKALSWELASHTKAYLEAQQCVYAPLLTSACFADT
jgi:hypothetical protein